MSTITNTASAVDFRETVRNALRLAWPLPNRSKLVAREINRSPRTVQDWEQGRRSPNAEQLVDLMAVSKDVEMVVLELVALRRREKGLHDKFAEQNAAAMERRAAMVWQEGMADRRASDDVGDCDHRGLVSVTRRRGEQA